MTGDLQPPAEVGALVRIQGLQNRPELNGQWGLIKSPPETAAPSAESAGAAPDFAAEQRWGVRCYSFKSNVAAMPPMRGDAGGKSVSRRNGDIVWKHLGDVSIRRKNLEVIEVVVVMASHITKPARLLKLCHALNSMRPRNQCQIDSVFLKKRTENVVEFRPKILLSISATESIAPGVADMIDMLGTTNPLAQPRWDLRATMLFQGTQQHSQCQHLQKLLPHIPKRKNCFVLFHDDDDLSGAQRFLFAMTEIVEAVLATETAEFRNSPHFLVSMRAGGVVRHRGLPGVDYFDPRMAARLQQEGPGCLAVNTPDDVDRLLGWGAVEKCDFAAEAGELYSQVIVAEFFLEFFEKVPAPLLRSKFGDMGLVNFIRQYPLAATLSSVDDRSVTGQWRYYYSNHVKTPELKEGEKCVPRTVEDGTGGDDIFKKMLIQMRKHALGDGGIDHACDANFDDLQDVDRDVLATAFYRSAFRLCDGHPQNSKPAEDEERRRAIAVTSRSNAELFVVKSAAIMYSFRVPPEAAFVQRIAKGRDPKQPWTWDEARGCFCLKPEMVMRDLWDTLLVHTVDPRDEVSVTVQKCYYWDLVLRVARSFGVPISAGSVAALGGHLREKARAVAKILQPYVPKQVSAKDVETFRQVWCSYAESLLSGVAVGGEARNSGGKYVDGRGQAAGAPVVRSRRGSLEAAKSA